MRANKTLLRMKFARIINLVAEKAGISHEKALDFFYHSYEYQLLRQGVGDIHCMSDDYLVEDLLEELADGQGRYQ